MAYQSILGLNDFGSNDFESNDLTDWLFFFIQQSFRDRLAAMPSHDDILAAIKGQQGSFSNDLQPPSDVPTAISSQSSSLKRPAPEESPTRAGANKARPLRNAQSRVKVRCLLSSGLHSIWY